MKALLILDSDCDQNEFKSFLDDRNIIPDTHTTGRGALTAFKASRYRYVIVSMELEREDPLEIISHLRLSEQEQGLPPTLLLVAGQHRQPSVSELKKYNICGVIRSHRM
jgi:PleD family two-component response regulator